ncbi:MAG: hypothetical protein V4580_06010 [Bacteroidota bacterium]
MTKNYFSLFLFLLVFTAFSNACKAQLFNGSFQPYWIIYDDEANGQNPGKFKFDFKEIKVTIGRTHYRYIYNYDKQKRLSSYLEERPKHPSKNRGFLVSYHSESKTQKNRVVWFKRQVAYKYDSSQYNLYDKLIYYHVADKNGNLKAKDIYEYDSTLIVKHENFKYKKHQPVLHGRQVYEYEIDKQLKKVTYYNRKGKAYKNTLFDCNPGGVNHKIARDSIYKCVKYETDSLGNKIEITMENVKNRSTKVVKYFNSQNKLIAQKHFDVKKDVPLFYSFVNPETGATIKHINFNKGKEAYKFEILFDDKNNKKELRTYYKNKVTSVFRFEYDPQGLLVQGKGYNRHNKLERTVFYTYGLKE